MVIKCPSEEMGNKKCDKCVMTLFSSFWVTLLLDISEKQNRMLTFRRSIDFVCLSVWYFVCLVFCVCLSNTRSVYLVLPLVFCLSGIVSSILYVWYSVFMWYSVYLAFCLFVCLVFCVCLSGILCMPSILSVCPSVSVCVVAPCVCAYFLFSGFVSVSCRFSVSISVLR